MFRIALCCVLMAIVCAGCINIHAEKNSTPAGAETKKITPPTTPILRHVLLFKFKDDTSPEKIHEVEEAFASLPGKISAIQKFEWGTNVSVENRSDGFTHCFVVSFLNEAGLDAYLSHPDLKEFRKTLGCLDKVLVVDYWVK